MGKDLFSSTVLVWFLTHFQIDSRDWDVMRKYGSPYHPLWGYYKSDDPAILKKQIDAMKRAKIDVVGYDVFPTYKWTPGDIEKDRALPIFTSLLEEQRDDEEDLKYCIIFENYSADHTYEDLSDALLYVCKKLINNRYYFTHIEKPFVIVFWWYEKNLEICKKLQRKYSDLEIHHVGWIWSPQEGCLYDENYPQTVRSDWIPVSPGVDSSLDEIYVRDVYRKADKDSYLSKLFERYITMSGDPNRTDEEIRVNALYKVERENGLFYKKQLMRAIKHNPQFICISSWNDWLYQNQIEPAEEYGFKYVDMTAEILEKSRK